MIYDFLYNDFVLFTILIHNIVLLLPYSNFFTQTLAYHSGHVDTWYWQICSSWITYLGI